MTTKDFQKIAHEFVNKLPEGTPILIIMKDDSRKDDFYDINSVSTGIDDSIRLITHFIKTVFEIEKDKEKHSNTKN